MKTLNRCRPTFTSRKHAFPPSNDSDSVRAAKGERRRGDGCAVGHLHNAAKRQILFLIVRSGQVKEIVTSASPWNWTPDPSAEGTPRSTWTHGLQTFSIQSVLDLKAGDKVWLEIDYLANAELHEDAHNGSNLHYTHFSGWLMHENISITLDLE